MKQLLFLLTPLILFSKLITGSVTDKDNVAIPFATITVATTSCSSISNINGLFKLDCTDVLKNGVLTGAKNGYLIGSIKLKSDISSYELKLAKVPNSDNAHYKWIPSIDEKNEKACQNCHKKLTTQWKNSAHGSSAENQTFKDIYNKIYKSDFNSSYGNCANCHQPINETKNISCDFCHKIYRVNPKKNLTGTLAIELRRPQYGGKNILFGSVKDAYTRDDSYSPLYKSSKYCASCHSGHFWDEEVYNEYSQWQNSSYSKQGISCQKCHMPPQMSETFIAPPERGGLKRSAGAYHSHKFRGSKDIEFMKKALDINVSVNSKNDINVNDINVSVSLENIGAGHSFPTGSPLHHLILVVDVKDYNSKKLVQLSGEKLPNWSVTKQSAGSVFAKVYRSSPAYTTESSHFKPLYPNPYWRPSQLEFDTRLKANSPILKQYIFKNTKKSVNIEVKLIYRRIYYNWAKNLGKKLDDDIILFHKIFKLENR